jgi:hypothetical protein
MIRTVVSSLAALLLLFIAACGSGTPGAGSLDAQPRPVVDRSASIIENGTIAATHAGGWTAIEAYGLSGARVLIGRVEYDPELMHFAQWERPTADGELWLTVDNPAAGCVEFGWALADFENRPAQEGTLDLGRVRFASGAAPAPRSVSGPPEGTVNEFTVEGTLDTGNIPQLTWPEQFAGDGSNDGAISLGDITSIAQQFNRAADSSPAAMKADYNRDGVVSLADITVIAQNFQDTLGGYAILSGPAEDSLTELTRLNRADEFPSPSANDGVLQWSWEGAAIAQDTYFAVQPFSADGDLGIRSTNAVLLEYVNPEATITGIVELVVPDTPGVTYNETNDYYEVFVTELSVDDLDGNAEPFAPEMLQLSASVLTDLDPGPVPAVEGLSWFISAGGGLAAVNDEEGSKGQLTFMNRGQVEVTAQVPGNFDATASVTFVLLSIDSLTLTDGDDNAGPLSVTAGDVVQLKATGTFDWDGEENGNELTQDLTSWVNWTALSNPEVEELTFNTGTGTLDTTPASGSELRVTCQYPRTDNITLFDNQPRTSNFLVINVN